MSPDPAASAALDAAIATWLATKSRRSNSLKTQRAYSDTMASFRAALVRDGFDLDGDPVAVAGVLQSWAGEGEQGAVAPTTHNQRLAIISSFYSFARKRGLLQIDNPVSRVERQAVQNYAHAEALSPEEVKALLEAIDRTELAGKRDYALLSVALISGRRLGEIVALRWGDVRHGSRGVTLTFRKAKGNKVMQDTLPRPVATTLLDYVKSFYGTLDGLPATAPLWVSLSHRNRGVALDPAWLERTARRRLGVNFHALRHTFARTLEDAGAKVSDIQARLGHESLATTGRYLAALRRAENPHADRLAELFGFGNKDEDE